MNMFGLGKVTCSFCNARGRRRDARKALDAKGVFVCASCYAAWEKSGRKCIACDTPVRGLQDVGLFTDRKNLGHTDCGGFRVLRA
jgi:hypothetical protein